MSAAKILVVDDEADIRNMVREILADEGYEVFVASNAAEARAARQERDPDLILLDIWMPDTDGITLLREWEEHAADGARVVMMSGHGTVDTAVEATRLGAFDFIEKPLSLARLLRTVERAIESGRAGRGGGPSMVPPLIEPIGKSTAMQSMREQIRRAAAGDAPVLLVGEPGTGRETLARYLHALSARAERPFVSMVQSAIDDAGAEAALLGTLDGGTARRGCLERARGGTLFVNELGDMNPTLQRLLLSVLESGRYLPLDASQHVALDMRFVASAQPDIARQVDRGRFRKDLYGLLDVLTIRVPPLREYREDVPELLRYYVDALVDHEKLPYRRFSVAAQNRLRNYPWPGNIRELKNMVHRFLMLGEGEEITLKEVESAVSSAGGDIHEPLVKQDLLAMPLREAREHFERAYLEQQLQLCGGRVGKLAERVGLERTHLYRKLHALGIDFRQAAADDD